MTREIWLKKAAEEAARPGHTSKEPGFGTVSGGSVNPPGRHWEHGQSLRRYSKVYMPAWWPSLQEKLSA